MEQDAPVHFDLEPLPVNEKEALQWLLTLVKASDDDTLLETPISEFRRAWFSIGFLYPGLHPDSASEHGGDISNDIADVPEVRKAEPRLLVPYFVQSGWPVVLVPILAEAWRRYEANEMLDSEFYCSEAVIAGICYRNQDLLPGVWTARERMQI